ncbi:c-type cytochrome [bacterium]|nr:c-type cytochrome [bacterium]
MLRFMLSLALSLGFVALAHGADPKPVFDSGVITSSTPGHSKSIDVDVTGKKELYLVAKDGGDGFGCDWADWVEPKLIGPNGEKKLTELKWKSASTGYGQVHINGNAQGQAMSIDGKAVSYGLGTHANSVIVFDIPEGSTKFQAKCGLDTAGTRQGCGSTVQFLVFVEKPTAKQLQGSEGPEAASHEAADALAGLDVGEGLEATLFAAEPMLKNPSNIDIDHLGRVWVVELMNYRHFANQNNPERPEGDRILVLVDTNGDGQADKQTVFYQGRDMDGGHGICVLGDRVIVSAGDSVFSLYDRDGDLKADADSKEFLFTGISGTQHDHGIHAVVFGPDGKLYFNFGNSGKQLKDKNGNPIRDKAGNYINDSRQPYQEGMVFRCNLDGSEVETLGWNFRNNWEVAVDSFGTMWQSDNDDDGNRGVRINYVMEFGNYGYRDEITGAGWRDARTNIEEEIPLRHWHLNDPGVVPNLLQTGAGSPTGMCVYEGALLPKIFQGALIHCDAGPNVVRAYITEPDGAGYKAEIVNILEGTRDKWFRPSDVCVAPDGSLIIADWYDPGVGGHRQGDVDHGRLFRVAPPGVKYTVPKTDFTTVEGAIAAIKSPNMATRYLAWQALHKMGDKAEAALATMYREDSNPRNRARAFWLLAKFPPRGMQYVQQALNDSNTDMRCAAIRALREIDTNRSSMIPRPIGLNAKLRREVAILLHGKEGAGADAIWTILAAEYDGHDRWELEALGIGATGQWDTRLEAYLKAIPDAAKTKAGRDIIWRSRGTKTPELLAQIIADPKTPAEELPRYFRAFDFLTGDGKTAAINQLAFNTKVDDNARAALIMTEALDRVPGFDINQHPDKKAAVNAALDNVRGTVQFLALIERFQMADRYPEVIAMVQEQPDSQFAVEAAKALFGKKKLLQNALNDKDPLKAAAVARAIGNTGDNRAAQILAPVLDDVASPLAVRQEVAKGLAKSKQGVMQLLERAKGNKLTDDVKPAVAFALQNSQFGEFRGDIVALFPLPPSRNDQALPPLDQLYKRQGNFDKGKVVFNTVGKCNTCHVVNNEGKEVGPNLSEIGSKLSREAMFESVLYPSAGISHNYETWTAVTADGNSVTGIKVSETGDELQLKGSDAIVRTLKKSDIDELVKQPVSLMPADLQKTMTVDELVDVIEYVQTLKKK